MSALAILRDATTKGQPCILRGDAIVIGAHSFPRKIPSGIVGLRGEDYPLDALWSVIEADSRRLQYANYLMFCKDHQIIPIQFQDHRHLVDFLKGKKDSGIKLRESLPLYQSSGVAASGDGERPSKRARQLKPSNEWNEEDIMAEEEILWGRSSILSSNKKSLENCIKIYERAIASVPVHNETPSNNIAATISTSSSIPPPSINNDPSRRSSAIPPPTAPSSVPPSSSAAPPRSSHSKSLTPLEDPSIPIIIVPSAPSSVLTIYNALDFLQNGVFKLSDELKKKTLEGKKKEDYVVINRSSLHDKTKNIKYIIVEDTRAAKFTSEEWNRVVAVFVTGANWQFSKWPWKTPADIFESISAYHMHFDDETLHTNIKLWNCKRLSISKTKRYQDTVVATDFWNSLSQYLMARAAQKKLTV